MSDSIWKKEISFGKKKPKPETPVVEQTAVEQVASEAPSSVWKKEISFGKKKPKAPKQPKAQGESLLKKEISFGKKKAKVEAPVVEQAAVEAPSSVWKKEISFGKKKPKAPKQPKAQSESFLKKEISFGRKKHDREVERLAQEAVHAVAPTEVAPVVVPPPTALAEAVVASMPEPEAPAPVEPVVADVPVPVEPVVAEVPVPMEPVVAEVPVPMEPVVAEVPVPMEPVALAAVPDVAFVEHASEPEQPVAELPVQPEPAPVVPESVSTLSPAILAASADVPVEPTVPEPVAYEPAPAVEPVAYEPAPAVEPVAEAWVEPAAEPVETWLAEPELPPAPPAVVVHPPVPAAELPPLPEAEAKVPFWKKEVSLGKKAKAPKAPKAAKAPKQKAAAGTPFWKKELSLGKKSPGAAVDAPTAQLPAAKPKSEPFWKKQVGMPKVSGPKLSSKGGNSTKNLVGLKIGASQLAAARVSNNGVAALQQVAREVLAPGVVVGGELRDPEALAESLKAFFARHKLPKKGVRLGIASNRIGVRIFDIVGVTEEKQLANAIQFRAQEALPIPLDEAVLDYRVLDESTDAEGNNVKRVLLVVAYRELVDRYVGACRKAGITLAGIDLEAFALLRALAAPAEPGNSALVAVAIGHDRSTFAVSDGRVCEFTRVLEWGGSALNVALARAFDSTPSEVEALKRSISLDGTVVPAGLTEEQTAVALDAVRRQVQSFARELVSSLQFYQNQPGSLGIGEIVLTGGTTHLPGIADELQRLIGVRVRIGDPLARLKVAKRVAETDQLGSLAVAIGLGIED